MGYTGKRSSQPELAESPILRAFYSASFCVDYLIAYFFKIRLPAAFGKPLVIDRFVTDALVDLEIITGLPNIEDTFFGRILLRLLEGVSVIIYLEADLKVLQHRRPEHVRDSFVQERLRLYVRLTRKLQIPRIKTSRPPEETFGEVLTLVMSHGNTAVAHPSR